MRWTFRLHRRGFSSAQCLAVCTIVAPRSGGIDVYRLVGSICLFALAAFILAVRWRGMRTGELPERGAVLSCGKNPRIFHYAQIAYAALAIFAFVAAMALALGLL